MLKFFRFILILIIPLIAAFAHAEENVAENSLKINSINFDNSDSIIFLGTSAQNISSIPVITKKTLTNPSRVYFDIDNSVITFPNTIFELRNSRLKQLRIAQNSITPNVVRIVLWSSDGYDSSQIKILNIKNNIIIKLGSEKPLQQYLTQVYKESENAQIEYYDRAVVIAEGKNTFEADEIFNSVQKAFSDEGEELVRPNIEQKQARLKSRFFLDNVQIKNNGILLNGIGVVNVEKPFILTDPSRIIFDLPNTIVHQDLRGQEFKLKDGAVLKIGQFEPSKARIVIQTQNMETFLPVYLSDLQTLFIANYKSLPLYTDVKTMLTSLKQNFINSDTEEINILFSNPVIYSLKRTKKHFKITFYNLENFDFSSFNAIAQKNKTEFIAERDTMNNYTLTFSLNENDFVDCYETLNASQLRFVISKRRIAQALTDLPESDKKLQKMKKSINFNLSQYKHKSKKNAKKIKKEEEILLEKLNTKKIVIDPGHGGSDTGALRGNTLEKNLTLEIALKVRDYLKEKGLTNIIMTRTTDKTLSLDERVQISNINDAAIFVSIHINASVKSEIKGIETHYYTEHGYNLAKLMHKELIENINAVDRGLFKSKFYVIKHTEVPAILLELGFISNEHERNELKSEERQEVSARAIAEGIVKFLTEQINNEQ